MFRRDCVRDIHGAPRRETVTHEVSWMRFKKRSKEKKTPVKPRIVRTISFVRENRGKLFRKAVCRLEKDDLKPINSQKINSGAAPQLSMGSSLLLLRQM